MAAKDNTHYTDALPFYGLSDQEFKAVIGVWDSKIDDDIDLLKILPNPDNFDLTDPDLMFNTPSSDYYTLPKLNRVLDNADPNSLSLYHFNTRSLSKKIDILKEFICSLHQQPSVIGITETKLNKNSVTNIELKGYKLFHTDSITDAGGAAIYVSKDLKYIPRKDIKFRTQLVESSWIEIDPSNGKPHIIIGCVYRHPNANLIEFTSELQDIMQDLNQSKYQTFIMGDVNIDFLKFCDNIQTEEYLDMIYLNNFLPLITKPTRITDHSKTLIDHMYTNSDSSKIRSGIATFDISDHLPIFSIVSVNIIKHKENISYRDYSKFNCQAYTKELREINWDSLLRECSDLHDETKLIVDTISAIANKHAPLKSMSQGKQKLHLKPWISAGILKSIKRKQKMYKTHFLSKNPTKVEAYKKYSNKLIKIKNIAKRKYYTKRFELCRNNMKVTWRLIGTIINRKTKGQTTISTIQRNNKTYTAPTDIANQFNEHFTNVGPNLARLIDHTNEDPCKYISNSPSSSFYLKPVSQELVKQHLSELNESKSTIGIPNKLLKLAANEICIPLQVIYNKSIQSGIVPNLFKTSRVTPIYKSGEVTNPNNYRPISTLSSFSKILEKIVYDQLISFLDKHKILFTYQFGFRKQHSTEQALLEITDNLKQNIDKKLTTCGLFLDFTKAFDTIDHNILLLKLQKYGIRGIPYTWFSNYILNRQQFVKVNNTYSNTLPIKCGVPQGSTLGPLLFLLYINDLPNSSKKLLFRIFADDTNIFYSAKSVKDVETTMNEEMKLVLKYCATNKLSVNLKKTNYMLVTSKQIKTPINIDNIECKSSIKYLGVYIDDKLNWNYQITHINNKITKNIGILCKLRYYLNLKSMKQLYFSLIYPYLNYGLLSWGNTYVTKLNKIRTKQNTAVRRIFFAKDRENADSYYKILQILKLDDILKLKIGCLTYKILNTPSTVPVALQNYYTKASSIHQHNTRYASKQNLQRPKIRTNYGKHSSMFLASKVWEEIPQNIKISSSSNTFRSKLKSMLLLKK